MAEGPDFATPDGLYLLAARRHLARRSPTATSSRRRSAPAISHDGAKHPVTRGLPGGDADAAGLGPMVPADRRAKSTSGVNGHDGRGDNGRCSCCRASTRAASALLLSDQMWLWARGYDGGGPHLDLLRRLAHWLMKEPELEEEALRASARGRDIDDRAPEPEGRRRRVERDRARPARRARSHARRAPSRACRARRIDGRSVRPLSRSATASCRRWSMSARTIRCEFQEVVSTTEKLRPLAEATGGTRSAHRATAPATAIAMPRVVAMHQSPSYGGADYIGIKRTGVERRRRRRLDAARGGLPRPCRCCSARWCWSGGARDRTGGSRSSLSALPGLERQ